MSSGSSAGSSNGRALRPQAPLPDEPGVLIAREPVLGSGVGGGIGGTTTERILYTTTNERGAIVPVSGAVYTPAGFDPAAPKGTIVLAPGTRGMGDQCAPSSGGAMFAHIEMSSANVNYEAPIAERLAREGYRVVVTDYIGMGTPGVHTYLNRVDQGHALIDAARATTSPNEKTFFYGYSQGGGAAAAAGELQPEYAPELNVVGIFAGAPPADPLTMLEQGNMDLLEGVASFVIASYAYSYPEFREAIAEYGGPSAMRYLAAVSGACLAEGTMSSAPLERYNPLGVGLREIVANDERVRAALISNRLGTVPVKAPILIVQSPQDNVVPFAQGEQLADDYRALGSPVTFRSVDVSDASSRRGLGHVAPAISENRDVIEWMNARFAGDPL